MRVARSYDDEAQGNGRRPGLPALLDRGYEVLGLQRAAAHAAEALECLGGNGFVEESGMPVIYRDAPLNSIWEGSGNVAALDVLRAIVREPEGLSAFQAECESAAGAPTPGSTTPCPHPRAGASRLPVSPAPSSGSTTASSRLGGRSRSWPSGSRPRCSSAMRRRRWPMRLRRPSGRGLGRVYGTLPAGVDAKAIIDRALPDD